jgi:hypothetical protein
MDIIRMVKRKVLGSIIITVENYIGVEIMLMVRNMAHGRNIMVMERYGSRLVIPMERWLGYMSIMTQMVY